MNRMYVMLVFASISSIGVLFAEEIELSPRLGKSLSLEARNYFGLFPEFIEFRSAPLQREGRDLYFLIETRDREVKLPTNDTLLSGLRDIIENIEELMAGKWRYQGKPRNFFGLIKIQTYLNPSKNRLLSF